MKIERYTERAQGFLQAAQTIAMREGHPQFTPEHILKALLDDQEGMAAGLIDRAGGNSRQARREVDAWIAKQPKVSGAASQPQATRELLRLFDTAEKAADKAGTASLRLSDCFSRLPSRRIPRPEKSWAVPASPPRR